MPMSFPDMSSLEHAAELHKFRLINEGETEEQYRRTLAQHVEERGHTIEAQEIRTGKGWDEFSDNENLELLLRALSRAEAGKKV